MQFLSRTLIVTGIVFLVGCGQQSGPELGEVSGRISLDGVPLEAAYVTFLPMFPEGIELVGKTDAEGNYEIQYSKTRKGVLLGKHQVLVSTLDDIKLPTGANQKVPERIPAIYVNEKSPLYFEVKAGKNDASFDIPSKPDE